MPLWLQITLDISTFVMVVAGFALAWVNLMSSPIAAKPQIHILDPDDGIELENSRTATIEVDNQTEHDIKLTSVEIIQPIELIIINCLDWINDEICEDDKELETKKVHINFRVPGKTTSTFNLQLGYKDRRNAAGKLKVRVKGQMDRPYFRRISNTLEGYI